MFQIFNFFKKIFRKKVVSMPLINAARNNDTARIQQLCQSGIDPNSVDDGGSTALCHATGFQAKEAIKALVAAGADIDLKNSYGNTPLHVAAHNNNPDIISLLASLGAKIDARRDNGLTPIHVAAISNKEEAVTALQAAGSKVDVESFKLRRLLFNVFNNHLLAPLLQKKDSVQLEQGGLLEEAAINISDMLKQFAALKSKEKKLKPLINALDAFIQNNGEPQESKVNVFATGCRGHAAYVVMKERTCFTSFLLAERGLFARENNDTDKVNSILKKQVPSAYKMKFAKTVHEARNFESDKAYAKIYQPASPWLIEPVLQKPFKNGHCYFENLKTLILSEFIDLYGFDNGKILYKEFDIFMHEKALEKYFAEIKDSNKNEVKKICENIIRIKKKKLQDLQMQTDQTIPIDSPTPLTTF